jgi:hypothetical protein
LHEDATELLGAGVTAYAYEAMTEQATSEKLLELALPKRGYPNRCSERSRV